MSFTDDYDYEPEENKMSFTDDYDYEPEEIILHPTKAVYIINALTGQAHDIHIAFYHQNLVQFSVRLAHFI